MKLLLLCLLLCITTACEPDVWAQDATTAVRQFALPEGVTRPKTGTAFAVDLKANVPSLLQLHPTEVVSNSHAAGNFARSAVYAGPHASVEIKGLNSAVSLASSNASFLVRINSDDPELLRQRVHLIRLDQTKDRRVVSTYSQNIFGGQRTKKYNDIAVTKTDAEPDIWLKVTPLSPLAPGEYGIIFMPKDSNLFPDFVYDFNIAFDAAKPEKH